MKKMTPQAFKQLQKKWYAKARESGFNDIEDDKERLKLWDSVYFHSKYTPERFTHRKDYYEWAEVILKTHPFNNAGEKYIWFLHSEGWPIRKIVEEFDIKKWVVEETIKRITKTYRQG